MSNSIRAFSDNKYDYYELAKPFGMLPVGSIFYYDYNDHSTGTTAKGTLKLCWSKDGDCVGGITGGSVLLHWDFMNTDWFKKVAIHTNKNSEKYYYVNDIKINKNEANGYFKGIRETVNFKKALEYFCNHYSLFYCESIANELMYHDDTVNLENFISKYIHKLQTNYTE